MPREWGGQCPMDCIDPVSNGCYGSHRLRPWHWALGYCTKAGSYYQGFAPVRDGEGPWSNTRIRDGEVRVCEVHAERLREYKQYVQPPSGGQATSAVEFALVADAIRVRSGRPARPYDELVATAELPDGLPCDFIEVEPEWITAKRRRCDQLEAETTDLRSRVAALEVEVVVAQLVAEVASRALSAPNRGCN